VAAIFVLPMTKNQLDNAPNFVYISRRGLVIVKDESGRAPGLVAAFRLAARRRRLEFGRRADLLCCALWRRRMAEAGLDFRGDGARM